MPETELVRRLDRLDRTAAWMDSAMRIPGTRIRLGLDSILGLIPGIGDAAALAPSLWIMNEARALGAPGPLLARMGGNCAIDAVVGTIPLIGDIFDVGFKANRRNVALLRRHVAKQKGRPELERLSTKQPAEDQPTNSSFEKK